MFFIIKEEKSNEYFKYHHKEVILFDSMDKANFIINRFMEYSISQAMLFSFNDPDIIQTAINAEYKIINISKIEDFKEAPIILFSKTKEGKSL